MKIALASDLHLEYGDINLQNTEGADVLVLAGDILLAQDLHDHPKVSYSPEIVKILGSRQLRAKQYRDFIARCSSQFPHVVVIAGNHEFYHGKWIGSIDTLRREYGEYPNVHYLERDLVKIDDVTFVGGTLWTDYNRGDPMTVHAVKDLMNDFRTIRHDNKGYSKIRPSHVLSRHRDTIDYFKFVIDDRKDDKIVVVSHMAPCSLSIDPNRKNHYLMNGAYYSDLSDFILDRPQIKLWCHGHMHNFSDYTLGDTRVVCNPRGYVSYERGSQEEDPFYPKIIEV